ARQVAVLEARRELVGDLLELPRLQVESVRPDEVRLLAVAPAEPAAIGPDVLERDHGLGAYERAARAAAWQDHQDEVFLARQTDDAINVLEVGLIRCGRVHVVEGKLVPSIGRGSGQ